MKKNILPRSFFLFIKACKTPGYFLHPVLGCIGIQDHIMRSNGQWVDKCAEDGGKLILIDSAAKEQALANILGN